MNNLQFGRVGPLGISAAVYPKDWKTAAAQAHAEGRKEIDPEELHLRLGKGKAVLDDGNPIEVRNEIDSPIQPGSKVMVMWMPRQDRPDEPSWAIIAVGC